MHHVLARIDVPFAVRYLLYPVLALATLGYLAYALGGPPGTVGRGYAVYLATLVTLMLWVEARHAVRADWRMTWPRLWRRDLPFLLLGGATIGAANWAAAQGVIAHALSPGGFLGTMPLVPGVVAAILLTDFLWYWLHRASHAARGGLGRFLWRLHATHHLPQQVYVMMHAVAHPLNTLAVRAILTVPPYLLGFSPEVVFAASVITALQGLVSHFNVDIRVGWLNYLLIGTELHRYHHSADPADEGNHGAVVSVWDQLFGTFVYRPGQVPVALGVSEPGHYPRDTRILALMVDPLRPSAWRA